MVLNYIAKAMTIVLALSVSACATTKQHHPVNKEKKGYATLPPHMERNKKLAHKKYRVGTRYKIKGVAYVPYENFDHEEVGMASWYGPGFHGKKTSMGTRYNMHALTCAHRTLQTPCKVQVTNLENGRSLVLTVNDRGPFARNRILDISREGARRLGFLKKGHTKIHLKVLKEPSLKLAGITRRPGVRPSAPVAPKLPAEKMPEFQLANIKNMPKANAPKLQLASLRPTRHRKVRPSKVYIQAGAFKNYKGASSLSKKLAKYGPAYIASTEIKGENHYRVRLGPFKSSDHAQDVMAQMTQKDCGDAQILQLG